MIVSGGQCPIRAAVGTKRGEGDPRRLPVLKNGPLCLAVYGGRDLAGLPSTDSHRGWTGKGVDARNPVENSHQYPSVVDFFRLPCFLPISCPFCPLLLLAPHGNTFRGDSVRLRDDPSQWSGISWQQRCGHRIALTPLTPTLAYPAWLSGQPAVRSVSHL